MNTYISRAHTREHKHTHSHTVIHTRVNTYTPNLSNTFHFSRTNQTSATNLLVDSHPHYVHKYVTHIDTHTRTQILPNTHILAIYAFFYLQKQFSVFPLPVTSTIQLLWTLLPYISDEELCSKHQTLSHFAERKSNTFLVYIFSCSY